MRKDKKAIPVNNFSGEYDYGISVERMALKDMPAFEMPGQAERHDRHSFHLLEAGTMSMEIDFQKYKLRSPSLICMHPDQVHRILAFKEVVVSSWALNNENLQPAYLKWLEAIRPAKPVLLSKETFALISAAVSLSISFGLRQKDQLYHSLLRDSCNTLVALVLAEYDKQSDRPGRLSRAEMVTRAFRDLLEQSFTRLERPAFYAGQLNISTAYLNECVKDSTGHPVSYHIQQRIVLEAKRLLCYSAKSVKEIAATLGYEDHAYFSRRFTRATGMTALAFRGKNRD